MDGKRHGACKIVAEEIVDTANTMTLDTRAILIAIDFLGLLQSRVSQYFMTLDLSSLCRGAT